MDLPESLAGHDSSAEYRTLLEVSRAIASHTHLVDLLHVLKERLHPLVPFDSLSVVLPEPARNVMRVYVIESSDPSSIKPGSEFPMEGSTSAFVWQNQEPLIVPDADHETRFPEAAKRIRHQGVRSSCTVPLTTPRRRLGTLNFGSSKPETYRREDLEILQALADQVAIAAENALNYEAILGLQEQLSQERDRLKLLLDVNNAVVSNLDLPHLYQAIPTSVRRAMQCDAVCLSIPDLEKGQLQIHGLDFPDGRGFMRENMVLPIAHTSPGRAFESGQPFYWGEPPTDLAPLAIENIIGEGFQSGCFLPISCKGRKLGVLHLLNRRPNAFSANDVKFLEQVASQLGIALENALEYRTVNESRNRLAEERLYLLDEIRSEHRFQEVVGGSSSLKKIIAQVETVAPTSSTVLVYGETGTGKELIARAIHNLSSRKEHTFVKVNCAAIPLGLLESELFGHEKGAFTGAIERKIGRFELAHKGTLFLDEIGDIPLELQPKLLRILQEQEFERLGSTRSIKVDVRVVAATNRPLGKMVEERQFRADLYYRLNVFPLALPALRERQKDIPELVRYFIGKYAQQMNKSIDTIPVAAMDALVAYSWPGNIRELQNFIERAVILSPGNVLQAPIAELKTPDNGKLRQDKTNHNSLAEAEREHIMEILRQTDWVLGGSEGAAARLGVPRTTLIYKMRRLGIPRRQN
jgi:formate hydrogenlyase transcriptional activator